MECDVWFSVTVEAGNPSNNELSRIGEYLRACADLDILGSSWSGMATWERWPWDTYQLSIAFPHLRFCVHADGDAPDDLRDDQLAKWLPSTLRCRYPAL